MKDRTVKEIIACVCIVIAYAIYMRSPFAEDGIILATIVAFIAFVIGRLTKPPVVEEIYALQNEAEQPKQPR